MALKATIVKAHLNVSDMTRHHYQDYNLTLAQHPSETEQRLMVRLLAFALNADEKLEFTKGLCADDEPEIWIKNYSDEIELWIELGLPDEKRLKKACNRAKKVILYTYGENNQDIWWQKNRAKLADYGNLSVFGLPFEATSQLAEMAQRSMDISVTVEEGDIWFSTQTQSCQLQLTPLQVRG